MTRSQCQKSVLFAAHLLAAVLLAVIAVGGGLRPTRPAGAATDGPPVIEAIQPQFSPTAGGAAIRLYGSGFQGTTAVRFGGVAAPSFTVIDSNLLTAVAPSATGVAANNTYVATTVTDDQGSGSGMDLFYTNATMSVLPESGLHPGDPVAVSVTGYKGSTGAVVLEASPLLMFIEKAPEWGGGPPPYVLPRDFPSTDPAGSAGTSFALSNPFTGSGQGRSYDPNIACPVTQQTANHGLTRCFILFSNYGLGSLERPISFTTDPVSAPPVVTVRATSTAPGATISLSGTGWSASPFFGSSTSQAGPGETRLTVELCNPSLSNCVTPTVNARVSLTRYLDNDAAAPGVQGRFTGATLDGSFTIPATNACAPTCVVRVQQERTAYPAVGGTNTFITATAPVTRKAAVDFDGNGTTDVGVFRPSAGAWYIRAGASSFWGASGDVPVPADYDGNGTTEIAVFRPSTGAWYVQGGTSSFWGASGDVPVPADYDGNGTVDVAVFRPSTGAWYVQGGTSAHWGTSGDIPVPADYDGNGTADIAVFRPSAGAWFVKGGPTTFWGTSGDVPVPADYDGDGTTDIAVFRPSAGAWFVNGGATTFWGTSGDVPVPGDYDGNGTTDIAVFRPANGAWFVRGGATTFWGASGDRPVPLPAAIYDGAFTP